MASSGIAEPCLAGLSYLTLGVDWVPHVQSPIPTTLFHCQHDQSQCWAVLVLGWREACLCSGSRKYRSSRRGWIIAETAVTHGKQAWALPSQRADRQAGVPAGRSAGRPGHGPVQTFSVAQPCPAQCLTTRALGSGYQLQFYLVHVTFSKSSDL